MDGTMCSSAMRSYWSGRIVWQWIITGRSSCLRGLSDASSAVAYTRSSWSPAASPFVWHSSWCPPSMAFFAKAMASSSVIVPYATQSSSPSGPLT